MIGVTLCTGTNAGHWIPGEQQGNLGFPEVDSLYCWSTSFVAFQEEKRSLVPARGDAGRNRNPSEIRGYCSSSSSMQMLYLDVLVV